MSNKSIEQIDVERLEKAILAVTMEGAAEPPTWLSIESAALKEALTQGVSAEVAEPWADLMGGVVSEVMGLIDDAGFHISDTDIAKAVEAAHGQYQDGNHDRGHIAGGVVDALGLPSADRLEHDNPRYRIAPHAAEVIHQLAANLDPEASEAEVTAHMMTGTEARTPRTFAELKAQRAEQVMAPNVDQQVKAAADFARARREAEQRQALDQRRDDFSL